MSATVDPIPYDALGTPIRGPRAFTDDLSRFWHLTFNIAWTHWKLRFFGSVLGYVWQLVRPLLMFGVLWVFFTQIGHIGQAPAGKPVAPYRFYGSQLLASIVVFTFFSEATGGAVKSVLESEALVRKIQFPRLVIPLSITLLALFNFALNLIVVFVFAVGIDGVRPMVSWVELPLLMVLLAVLSTGLAMLLSSLYVYFRDIAPIWDVVLQVLFYASPVIIPVTTVETKLSSTLFHLYMLSPLAVILQQFRHAIINHGTPSANTALGGPLLLAVSLAIIAALFVLGFVVFNRTAPSVAEDL